MKHLFIAITLVLSTYSMNAQKVALKTNLLYDATATANLGVEVRLAKQITLDLSGSYAGWDIDKQKNQKMRHYMIQPEIRFWTCESFNGHFFGLHGHYGMYNMSGGNWFVDNMKHLSNLSKLDTKNSRYEGTAAGAGVSYGYSWIIANRLNLDFTLGMGYAYLDYDRYGAPKCSPLLGSDTKHYFGITKVGVSLVFILN